MMQTFVETAIFDFTVGINNEVLMDKNRVATIKSQLDEILETE